MNMDFDGVNRVHIHTMRRPPTHCASPFKHRASPCKVHRDTMYLHPFSWYHYGLMWTFAMCKRVRMNTDTVDPVEVRIHRCFFGVCDDILIHCIFNF